MKDKEEIFKLLRESVETPQESLAVEEMIQKIEGNLPPIETVSDTKKIFKGYSFYKNKKGRFTCTISLHRFLWMYLNGEIPEGYDIHHKDFDKNNNSIDNLQLLTKDEHAKIHLAHKIKKKPNKKSTLVCVNCGCEYTAVYRGNNKFCSRKCQKEFDRKNHLEKKVCIICGEEFLGDEREDVKFCSDKCLGRYLSKREVKTCPICGKTFSARTNQKFCSPQCATESLKKQETRLCLNCGTEFSTRTKLNQKFCSPECFYQYKKTH